MAEIITIPENAIIYDIKLDLHNKIIGNSTVYSKQYDTNTRYIRAEVWNCGSIFPIPSTATIYFAGTQIGNNGLLKDAGIDADGKIVYLIKENDTNTEHSYEAEFRISDSVTDLKSTPKFKMFIERSALQVSTPIIIEPNSPMATIKDATDNAIKAYEDYQTATKENTDVAIVNLRQDMLYIEPVTPTTLIPLDAKLFDGYTTNHFATASDLQQVSLAYKESYSTLANLQSAYPSGNIYNHAVLADGMIYTYKNGWVSTGIQANGTGIANGSITTQNLNSALTNLLNLENNSVTSVNGCSFVGGGVGSPNTTSPNTTVTFITAFDVSLTVGNTIGFTDSNMYSTHEYAFGLKSGSVWIGGGYLHANYSVETTGIYTVMVHNTASTNILDTASSYNTLYGILTVSDAYTNLLKKDLDALTVNVNNIEGYIETNSNNYLYGKKIVVIGDSMVYGHNVGTANVWLTKFATRNNMTYVNYGINGCCLSYNSIGEAYSADDSVVTRYASMVNDADYILVFAGTNDATKLVSIGTEDSTDNTTFMGALNILCSGLITKYPNKKIGFITPYLRNANFPAYVTAIETICAKYSIPVFNNIKNGGVCWSNAAQVSALTLGDTYHLNVAGHLYASYKYENFLRSL